MDDWIEGKKTVTSVEEILKENYKGHHSSFSEIANDSSVWENAYFQFIAKEGNDHNV